MGLQLVILVTSLLWLTKTLAIAASLAKPGCLEVCGNVTIPYPFGVGRSCYMDKWFAVDCRNSTSSSGRKPFLNRINLEVLNISLSGATVHVNNPVLSFNCLAARKDHSHGAAANLTGSPFIFSETENRFIAVGCNIIALMTQDQDQDQDHYFSTFDGGCMSVCNYSVPVSLQNRCLGFRCCQSTIPPNVTTFNATFQSIDNDVMSCTYASLVDQNWFISNLTNSLELMRDMPYVPAVLDWNSTYLVDTYNDNTEYVVSGSRGLILRCKSGYQGNPYLPSYYGGCEDIDECADPKLNDCGQSSLPCWNRDGYYFCGFVSYSDFDTKKSKLKMIIIGVGTGLGILFLFIGTWRVYKVMKKRNKLKRKEKFFKHNGGLLLQQQLSSSEGSVEKTKLFNSKELEKATDNYNENRILGQGGHGTVYKGMLSDGRTVAVKKSKIIDESQVEQFINEVVVLSQINHRNVVKLLGCCLETEVPLLVYEFISNGTLFQYIHDQNKEFPLSWELRLRIAIEVAGALFYLHSAASIPIYHRDIKSTNILLDDKYKAKVSDFGTSRSIAVDQTHLTTLVQGTFGYLDPEYFQSSQFTDKSDVYSFGVVMVELLTGQNLSLQQDHKKEGGKEEIMAVANLAKRCLHLNGKKRPTMKEVAVELEGIRMSQGGSVVQQNCEDVESITTELAEVWDVASTSTGSCFNSGVSPSLDVQPLLLNES